MHKFEILATRARKNATAKAMKIVEATSQTEALRAYGCNVKKGQRKVVTRRGTIIVARKVA